MAVPIPSPLEIVVVKYIIVASHWIKSRFNCRVKLRLYLKYTASKGSIGAYASDIQGSFYLLDNTAK